MRYDHYSDLAELFAFPGPDTAGQGRAVHGLLLRNHPDAAHELARFLDTIPANTLDLQELHTRTFEVQSLTTLDIGYVLFGDDYKRGALLSNLNQEHARAQNDCRGELADYLPNLLRLIPKLDDSELRSELAERILVPALMLMIREFDHDRIEKKNAAYREHYRTLIDPAPGGDQTAYCSLLKAAVRLLEEDFQVTGTIARFSGWSDRPQSADFLRSVQKEMDIEREANPANSGCDA